MREENRFTRRRFIARAATTAYCVSATSALELCGAEHVETSESKTAERRRTSRREFASVAELQSEFQTPPKEFTLMPFWFWNDALDHRELARQIASFEAHGVYGFTIHPRIGLPEDSGWMSAKLLDAMRFALEEARRRGMFVMLYDEGMYPSGSSAGQVVAKDSEYAARGFVRVPLDSDGRPVDAKLAIGDDWNYAGEYERANGDKVAIYDAPSKGVIRGLHYIGDESNRPGEFSPPAADLLNPNAVDAFIELVYQRFYDEYREYFEDGTIVGLFTDEPSILGRGSRGDMRVGNLQALPTINRYLGYDFKPYLLDLWENASEESARRRGEYGIAVKLALEEIYYGRISAWCDAHGTSLCGHPAESTDIGVLRKFHIPGQDIVWRYIEPGDKAFDSTHSPMAKVASSAMIHDGRRRNLNEIFGAYGFNLTYDEMLWLINWCAVRGQNMFIPHAYYYSTRGPRLEERPPDVGPNSPWWARYRGFADYCARLCWLNTDVVAVTPVAMLVDSNRATAWGTKTLMREQIDFNYLEMRLLEDAEITSDRIRVGDAEYRALLIPPGYALNDRDRELLAPFAQSGRVIRLRDAAAQVEGAKVAKSDDEMIDMLRELVRYDVATYSGLHVARSARSLAPGLRVRHVRKGTLDFYLLFNEEETPLATYASFAADPGWQVQRWNLSTGEVTDALRVREAPTIIPVRLAPHETTIIAFEGRR
ncbi:MAG: hypothetical protein IJU03_05625 [Thermoguttaceae bacterium]|nr:hypothetical protein [Thermoguttaceae bacterium]